MKPQLIYISEPKAITQLFVELKKTIFLDRNFNYWKMLTALLIGVEWVKGLGHISEDARVISDVALQILHHPPSRKSQSRLRNAQNICAMINWCGLHSAYTNHQMYCNRWKIGFIFSFSFFFFLRLRNRKWQ